MTTKSQIPSQNWNLYEIEQWKPKSRASLKKNKIK